MSAKAFFMDTSELIILRSGDMAAGIAAQAGGSVAYWRQNGTDLLRPATKEALEKNQADATGMFPLVPYSNRIRGGSFIYWGVRRKVPKNHPLVDDPLHGESVARAEKGPDVLGRTNVVQHHRDRHLFHRGELLGRRPAEFFVGDFAHNGFGTIDFGGKSK